MGGLYIEPSTVPQMTQRALPITMAHNALHTSRAVSVREQNLSSPTTTNHEKSTLLILTLYATCQKAQSNLLSITNVNDPNIEQSLVTNL